MFKVLVRQAQRTINVDIGSTILETALSAGIDYPHGCRSGNCGACKSTLHSGDVELSPYSSFALSESERSDNLILACRAVPWSDCEVSWCELDDVAAFPVRKFTGRVEQVETLTEDIVSVKISFDDSQPFLYRSGQFAQIQFQGLPPREYSMASRSGDALLEFYIRRIEGGIVSPFVVDYLKSVESVNIEGPFGRMFYRERHQGPVIAIAGGSGLSALQPIVLEAVEKQPEIETVLYHGVRRESDIFRSDLFESLAEECNTFEYVPVLSEELGETSYRTGMLADILKLDITACNDAKFYLAGPPPMVFSCVDYLKALGFEESNIHADPFLNEADKHIASLY